MPCTPHVPSGADVTWAAATRLPTTRWTLTVAAPTGAPVSSTTVPPIDAGPGLTASGARVVCPGTVGSCTVAVSARVVDGAVVDGADVVGGAAWCPPEHAATDATEISRRPVASPARLTPSAAPRSSPARPGTARPQVPRRRAPGRRGP